MLGLHATVTHGCITSVPSPANRGRAPVRPVASVWDAMVKRDLLEEVPGVNCQERSQAELLETLEVTLREASS
jgi:hypothetical protein